MEIKEIMPIRILYNLIARLRLRNKRFTLITQNCIGGIIYHNLGLEFLSPTINMRIGTLEDFLEFCSNFQQYMQLPLVQDISSQESYPVGTLGRIKIHLNHYKTFEEAVQKWESRKAKIQFDNIYIIATDWGGEGDINALPREYIERWASVKCKNLIVFTQKKYDDIPYAKYIGTEKMKKMLCTNRYTGLRGFEYYWDVVKFLNSSNK